MTYASYRQLTKSRMFESTPKPNDSSWWAYKLTYEVQSTSSRAALANRLTGHRESTVVCE